MLARLVARLNQRAYAWVNLRGPVPAAEDTVMPDPGLQMVVLPQRMQPGAQLLRREGLADRADIVILALDGEQRGAPDRPRLDLAVARDENAARQLVLLKNTVDSLEIERRRQVHHR